MSDDKWKKIVLTFEIVGDMTPVQQGRIHRLYELLKATVDIHLDRDVSCPMSSYELLDRESK